MTSKTRFLVLVVSAPIIAFAVIGGFLGRVIARDDTYQQLRIFQDVVNLILTNYVETADLKRVMSGAMRGLAEGLDPDSSYLLPADVKRLEAGETLPTGETGLEITRQYYLRVVSARDNSPAAKAGLRPGDLIRAIDQTSTRDMSAFEGVRRLRGTPGSKVTLTVIRGNQADPHAVELTREALTTPDVRGRIQTPGVGYVRVSAFSRQAAAQLKTQIADLTRQGATSFVIDLRGTAAGEYDEAIGAARLFVGSGTLAVRQARGTQNQTISAAPGDGSIITPASLLTDIGTSGPAEVFAAALKSNKRAELIGERTLGRTTIQKLVRLSDGSGLWLTGSRYLLSPPADKRIQAVEPDVSVDQPDVEFGEALPTTDETLQKAIERLTQKRAA
jgi:carboxyl-terminal processing protease